MTQWTYKFKNFKNKFGEFFSPIGLGIHVCTYRSTLPATFFGSTNMILYFCNFWYFLQTHETQGFLVEVISSNVLVSPSWLGLTVSECLCYKWQLICSWLGLTVSECLCYKWQLICSWLGLTVSEYLCYKWQLICSWLGLTISECLCYKWQLICSFVVVTILFLILMIIFWYLSNFFNNTGTL